MINYNVAKTTITQKYINTSETFQEIEFFFPISKDSCFLEFSAEFQNQKIIGQIKKKDEAKEEFKENLEQGNQVAYSEILEESPEIMKIQLGNLQPNSEVLIKFIYLEELNLDID